MMSERPPVDYGREKTVETVMPPPGVGNYRKTYTGNLKDVSFSLLLFLTLSHRILFSMHKVSVFLSLLLLPQKAILDP